MKNSLFAIVSIALISSNLYAHGIDYLYTTSHKHGVANITIEWQNTELIVTAVFPAQDVVGFEHIPSNAKEKRAVRDAYKTFVDNPVAAAASCKPKEVKVDSALFDEHADGESDDFLSDLLGEKKDEEDSAEVPDHMDFQAVYQFKCDAGKQPLKFMSFLVFPSLKQANVHQGSLEKEPGQILNPKQFVINVKEVD